MIESLHALLGFASLISGATIFLSRKGTGLHRTIGKVYLISMFGLNLTAFGIYNLFDGFGIFHWAAILSLATLTPGYLVLVYRHKISNWLTMHYEFMSWSYVGLLGATSNEAFVHISYMNQLATSHTWLPMSCMLAVMIASGVWLKLRRHSTIKKTNYRRPGVLNS